jgi:hypothetical protein
MFCELFVINLIFKGKRLVNFFPNGATAPRKSVPPHYGDFTITFRHTTRGRNPLDEWLAGCRDIYLAAHNNHNRETSIPLVEFEPAVPEASSHESQVRPRCYGNRRVCIKQKNITHMANHVIACRWSATGGNRPNAPRGTSQKIYRMHEKYPSPELKESFENFQLLVVQIFEDRIENCRRVDRSQLCGIWVFNGGMVHKFDIIIIKVTHIKSAKIVRSLVAYHTY